MTDRFAPFTVRGEDLHLGGIPARELAEQFGTPLYVYDAGVIAGRYQKLRAALPDCCDILYAVKANPSLAVCSLLAAMGAGAEAASRGELLLASAAGFDPGSIVMAGPAKSEEDHREALKMGIRSVNVESGAELLRLHDMARKLGLAGPGGDAGGGAGREVPFGLRLNTVAAIEEEHSIIGGAGPRKFGVDEEEAASFLDLLASCAGLRLAGVHVFNATNVRDAARLVENAGRIIELAGSIAEELGRPLDYVDIGGGLGIPYGGGEEPLDVAALGRALSGLLEPARSGQLASARLIVEPGRYLVGEAGAYICRVVEVKSSRGRLLALVDGGIHHLLRPALLRASHPVALATRAAAGPDEVYDVAGPLCTGLDFLGRDVALPELKEGDLLAVLCAGAYGYTESMLEFLSHAAPAEVIVRDGQAGLARPRVEPEERLVRQQVPAFLATTRGERIS